MVLQVAGPEHLIIGLRPGPKIKHLPWSRVLRVLQLRGQWREGLKGAQVDAVEVGEVDPVEDLDHCTLDRRLLGPVIGGGELLQDRVLFRVQRERGGRGHSSRRPRCVFLAPVAAGLPKGLERLTLPKGEAMLDHHAPMLL